MSDRRVLGLLGVGIGRSMSPLLQETLGALMGWDVSYPTHDHPESFAPEIPAFFERQRAEGVVGMNVTYPFKERVVPLVRVDDRSVRAIGAVNTVRFEADGPRGYNTDFTGMQAAYRRRFGAEAPGMVAQLGAGGFGKAAIFALASVGASGIRLFDPDTKRAEELAALVVETTDVPVRVFARAEDAVSEANGVMNCSPIGMHIHPGCPVDPAAISNAGWVFDAVYAPLKTELLAAADARGIVAMSGSELFFWQGIHSFEIFFQTTVPQHVVDAAAEVIRVEVARRSTLGV